ncbi:MAG: transcription termination factor Rho [Clostridiales bacterium]|nr:transcription termination factor Rho [Clostridiales bacterium]MDY4008175.1 transcription termination factor Rho [Candidatus Limiplasma sp.]
MQNAELQAMTVVQLRKLAKENGVKLSAGIDKSGIVARLADALAEEAEPVKEEAGAAAEAATVVPEQAAPAQTELEKLQDAPLSADVTAVTPGSGFRPWNNAQDQGAFRPVYRQAWQARSTTPRDPAQKPAWQQTRPAGTVNRFGPQSRVTPQQSEAESADELTPVMQPAEQPRPAPENAPKLDGYRLGYRAAPQRPAYQNRNDYAGRDSNYGGYQPRNYQQNNYGYQPRNGYSQNNYRNQGAGYGYQQRPYQQAPEVNYNDGLYRMARDPQFAEQAESGQLPDLLKVQESEPASGILEILPDGYGFLRGHTLLPGKKDIYVSMAQIRRFGLRTGDYVEGKARAQRDSDKFAALLTVEKLNGRDAEENPDRLSFEQLVPVYPDKRIVLESGEANANMAIRLVDLIAPIGFGQRAMIVAPPDSGRLSLLREISRAIKRNDAAAEVLMLLIDIAPEEVTEIRESVDAEVFASTFADSPDTQTRVSETMLERAQRLVEDGRNVVILLDSLTKLTRAYQAALAQGGRPMTNTVTPAALVRPKRFFGAARNTRDAGSLTMIATIAVETGSRVDDIIYEEFKGTANMELFLCTRQPGDPVYPMIDLQQSGTKKDDMLLSDEQKEGLKAIRKVLGSTTNGEAVVQLIDMMQKTRCNADLLNRLQDWIALWEKSGYLKR